MTDGATPVATPCRIGVASLVEHPMHELAERARAFEDYGYDDIWVPDERLLRNVYVSLATVATATSHVGVGTAVTNPYTRHPVITASAIATIDELSGARATLALGAGGGLNAYGIDRSRPVQAIRETIDIVRRLTSGETITMSGKVVTLAGAHLDFPPVRQVPIYVAARGPRILELAGELADGVIIGGFAQPEGIGFAQGLVARGMAGAGRTWADVDQMSWLFISAARDPRAARIAVSKQVLASLITSRPILDKIGISLPSKLRSHLDATGWSYPRESPAEAAAMLPDDIVDAFSVHGTPEECVTRLRAIQSCGINHFSFVLFPPDGETVQSLAKLLADEVAGPLRSG